MQLAGPGVFGPAADRDAAISVLREAVDLGITHIDTADSGRPPQRWPMRASSRPPSTTS